MCLCFVCVCLTGRAQYFVEGVAAVVNGDDITLSDVRGEVSPVEVAHRDELQGNEPAEKIKEAHRKALQKLIDRKLIVTAFRDTGYYLGQDVLDQHVQSVIDVTYGGDRPRFKQALSEVGITEERFKLRMEEKLIVQAIQNQRWTDYLKDHPEPISDGEKIVLREKLEEEWLVDLRAGAYIKMLY